MKRENGKKSRLHNIKSLKVMRIFCSEYVWENINDNFTIALLLPVFTEPCHSTVGPHLMKKLTQKKNLNNKTWFSKVPQKIHRTMDKTNLASLLGLPLAWC